MKKLLLSAMLIFFANAQSLKSVLNYALKHNDLSVAKDISAKQPLLESESIKKDYFPKVFIGGSYQRLDPVPVGKAGDTYNAFAKVSWNLYNGNKRKYQIKAKKFQFKSLHFQSSSYKKELQFNIVNLYFTIKSLKATLNALKKAEDYLKAEYKRTKNLYKNGVVTEYDVKKIEASLFNTKYEIENVKYQISDLKEKLNLYVGKKVKNIDNSTILPPKNINPEILDNIKALQASSKELEYNAKTLNAAYKPQINIEDIYSLYDYGRDNKMLYKQYHQNQIILSVNMLIFDNNSIKKQKEAIKVQKLSLQKQIIYYTKQQKKDIKMALLNIKTIKSQIKSAKKSLESANTAFKIISNKYHVGQATIVDYLDALSVKTNAIAQYKTALNKLQVAYASYYLLNNKDIKNYIKRGNYE